MTNESFWDVLFNFEAVELEHYDFEIKLIWQSQKLNHTNILKSKPIAFIDNNEEIIEIGEVINMFEDYYKKYIDHHDSNSDKEYDIDYYSNDSDSSDY